MGACAGGRATLPELALPVLKLAVASGLEAPYAAAYNNYVLVCKTSHHPRLCNLLHSQTAVLHAQHSRPCLAWDMDAASWY